MESFTRANLQTLTADRSGPCVSIFTRTHRGGDKEGPIRWKNQLDDAEKRLVKLGMCTSDAADFVDSGRALLKDLEFWRNTSDGLAAFFTPGIQQTFRLPIAFENETVVGPRFQIKPLLSWFAGDGKFYILALSQNHVRLLEASAHSVRAIAEPLNMAESLKTHDRDEVLNFHTHHGAAGSAMQAVFHGQGVGVDDHKSDLLQYFQKVDRAISRCFDEHAPLVLATTDYLIPLYRKASKHRRILENAVLGNPDRLSDAELQAKALPIVAPLLHEKEEKALVQYRQLAGTGKTLHDITQILPAAQRGTLETLLLVPASHVWGKYELATGLVDVHAGPQAGNEDLSNLAAVFMLRHGRSVLTVSKERVFDGAPVVGLLFRALPHHGK